MSTPARSPAQKQHLKSSTKRSPSTPDNDTNATAYYISMNYVEFRNSKILADRIRKPLLSTDCETGVLYTMWGSNRADVKIGYTGDSAENRVLQICRSCEPNCPLFFGTLPFQGAHKAERILHTLLISSRHIRADCRCGKANREWYHEKLNLLLAQVRTIESWMKKEPYDLQSEKKTLKPEWLNALWEWEKSLLTREPIEIQTFFCDGPNIRATGELPTTRSLRNALAVREKHYFGSSNMPSLRNVIPTTQPPKENLAPDDLHSVMELEIENLLMEEPEDFMDQDFSDSEIVSVENDKRLPSRNVAREQLRSDTIPQQENSPRPIDLEEKNSSSGIHLAMTQLQRHFAFFLNISSGQPRANPAESTPSAEESEDIQSANSACNRISDAFGNNVSMPTSYTRPTELDTGDDAHSMGNLDPAVTSAIESFVNDVAARRIPGQWPEIIDDIDYGTGLFAIIPSAVQNIDISRQEPCIADAPEPFPESRGHFQPTLDPEIFESAIESATSPKIEQAKNPDSEVGEAFPDLTASKSVFGDVSSRAGIKHKIDNVKSNPPAKSRAGDSLPVDQHDQTTHPPDSIPGVSVGSHEFINIDVENTGKTYDIARNTDQASTLETNASRILADGILPDMAHDLKHPIDFAPSTTSRPESPCGHNTSPQACDCSANIPGQERKCCQPQPSAPAIFPFPFRKDQPSTFEFTFRKERQEGWNWQGPAVRTMNLGVQQTMNSAHKGLSEMEVPRDAQVYTQNTGQQKTQSGSVHASSQPEITDAWSAFIARDSAKEFRPAPEAKSLFGPLGQNKIPPSASQATKLVPGQKHILNGRTIRVRLPPSSESDLDGTNNKGA